MASLFSQVHFITVLAFFLNLMRRHQGGIGTKNIQMNVPVQFHVSVEEQNVCESQSQSGFRNTERLSLFVSVKWLSA